MVTTSTRSCRPSRESWPALERRDQPRPSNLLCNCIEANALRFEGCKSLNDFKAQEAYYHKITERWIKFCADAGSSEELERRFKEMSMKGVETAKNAQSVDSTNARNHATIPNPTNKLQKPSDTSSSKKNATTSKPTTAMTPTSLSATTTELNIILFSLRKLREALLATHRRDLFAQKAYIFSTRTAILLHHWESYHPSLLHLLAVLHPSCPLSSTELHEFLSYRILDLVCRTLDFAAVFAVKAKWGYTDRHVDRVVKAVMHGDWVVFWRAKAKVDGHARALMGWGEAAMRTHALKCLGKSYFTAEKQFVESVVGGLEWKRLVRECGVGWVLDEETGVVTIRRVKMKEGTAVPSKVATVPT